MDQYFTPADLGAMFKVSPEQVRNMARTKAWPSNKVGSRIRFSPEDVESIRGIIRTPTKPRKGSRKELHAALART